MNSSPNAALLKMETATRKSAWNFYTLGMYLPNPDPVLKKMGKDIQVYKELRSDSHVWSQIQKRKNGILAREWYLDRNSASVRNFKIVESLFKELDMYQLMDNVLDCVQFGYQPVELVWEKIGGLVLPMRITPKPPDWFCFSEENELLFRTKTNFNGEQLPKWKFICPTFCGTFENPYGEPTLARCFWPVTFKKGGWRFWSTFLEKFSIPVLIGKLPRNRKPEEFESLKEKLDEMVQDDVIVIPDDASVESRDYKGSSAGSDGFEKIVDKCNTEISKAQVGSTLTTEIGDVGSRAAAETHREGQTDFYEADKKIVRKFFDDVIRAIYEINFSESIRPQFMIFEEDNVKSDLAERDRILGEKLDFNEEYYEDKYGIDRKYFTLKAAQQNLPVPQPNLPIPPAVPAQFSGQLDDDRLPEPKAEEYQQLAEGILKPVIDLIKSGSEYTKVMERLAEAWPAMDVSQLMQMVQRARFIAGVVGQAK